MPSDCTLNSLNEGFQCQNCQDSFRLSEMQINSSDVQWSKQDRTVKAEVTKVEKSVQVTGKRPGSGPKSAFVFNFRNGRHFRGRFEPRPISSNFALS